MATITQKQGRRGLSLLARQRERWAYFFISPWIIGFFAFTLVPIVATLLLSFTNYDPADSAVTVFVGPQNYLTMLTDAKVGTSLLVTLRYGLLAVPITFVFGLMLAVLVNSKNLTGKTIFRTLFYMPYMIPVVAGGVIWAGVMNTQTGWLNLGLGLVGIKGPDWLNSPTWIYPALVLVGLWGVGNLMMTLLAGLQSVPNELYEAAEIDGASSFQRFWFITLPMISPVVFYNLIMMVITAFRYFDVPYVLKNGTGQPADATLFYNLNLYKNAFSYNLMGYAAALAWVLFIIVLALTVLMFNTSAKWVYYAGEGKK